MKRVGERLCFHRNGAATFVCVSGGVAEEMKEHYPKAANRVLTIHNGVDLQAFAPGVRRHEALEMRSARGIREERLVVVFVGGEWGHKGLRRVIEALPRAPGWDLVVAGRGHVAPYRELAESRGVGDVVHWLGIVPDIQIVYEFADAFILPSSYETFSLVTFEAAACALPIIATRVSGVRELIQDGQNGFLIKPEPRLIAERLNELATNPDLRARLGAAARKSALRFGWDVMVAKHHELYCRLASESS